MESFPVQQQRSTWLQKNQSAEFTSLQVGFHSILILYISDQLSVCLSVFVYGINF